MNKKDAKEIMNDVVEEIKNEMVSQDENEIILGTYQLVSQDNDFMTYRDSETGKYFRKMKFKDIQTIKAETKEQKLNLLKLRDKAIEIKKAINTEIKVGAIITEPYSSLDEDTGNTTYGATTTIITPDFKKCYVTSSKTFYNKLINETLKMFGQDLFISGEEIVIMPVKEKGREHEVTTFVYVD